MFLSTVVLLEADPSPARFYPRGPALCKGLLICSKRLTSPPRRNRIVGTPVLSLRGDAMRRLAAASLVFLAISLPVHAQQKIEFTIEGGKHDLKYVPVCVP